MNLAGQGLNFGAKPQNAFAAKPAAVFGVAPAANAKAGLGAGGGAFGNFGAVGGFGGFGAPAPAAAAPAPAAGGFGGFGGAQAFGAPAAGAAFGAPAAGAAFGAKPAAAFGAVPAAGGAFGNFGAPAAGAAPAAGGFAVPAFGVPGAAAGAFGAPGKGAGGAGAGAFGAAAFGQGAFGFPQQQQQNAVAPGGFGNLAFGAFGQQNAQMAPQPQLPQAEQQVKETIERLKRSYAPAKDTQGNFVAVPEGTRNDECAFKYIALKRKDGSSQSNQALLYGNLLEQAEKDNADPDNYFVVEELGIESLKRRFESQNAELDKSKGQVDKIRDVIKEVDSSNQLLSSRVALLKNRQLDLNRRMLSLMKKIEVIRCHGTPLQDTERQYYRKLLEMAQRLERPLQVVQNMSINVALHEQPEEGAIESISEEDLASFIAVLKKQSDGLEMLTDTLRKDLRDVDIIRQSLAGHL